MKSGSWIPATVVLLVAYTPVSFADPVTVSSAIRAEGDARQYNLDFHEASRCFRKAVDADPADPAAQRAVAGMYLLEIAFRRGTVTTDDFLGGDLQGDSIAVPKPPAELAKGFHEHAQRALALAEQQTRARPNDADAHYQLGTSIGQIASYLATVDGQVLGAFKYARRAYQENSRALELDPRRDDAGLLLGMYQYIVSTRAFPVRWFARLAGFKSGKAKGIQLVEAAARYPGENQTDAQFALVLIYNREGRYDDALKVLKDLQARYPRNRLLWLEAGAAEIRAGRFERAGHFLDDGLRRLAADPRPRAFGEEALWYYKRGAVRVREHRPTEAASDLRAALAVPAPGWVHGRAHAELGRLANLAGDSRAASREYRIAVQLAMNDGDSIGLAEAEQLLGRR